MFNDLFPQEKKLTFFKNSNSYLKVDVGIQGLQQHQTSEEELSSSKNGQMCMKQMILHCKGEPLTWGW